MLPFVILAFLTFLVYSVENKDKIRADIDT